MLVHIAEICLVNVTALLVFHVYHLSADHAVSADSFRQFGENSHLRLCVKRCIIGNYLERKYRKSIARKNSHCLAKSLVT